MASKSMYIKVILIFGNDFHFWKWGGPPPFLGLDFFWLFWIKIAVSTLVTNNCKKLENLTGNNFECSLTKTFKSLKYVHTIKTCLNIINRNILHLKWITKTFKSLKYVHTIKKCLNIINRNILHLKWITKTEKLLISYHT